MPCTCPTGSCIDKQTGQLSRHALVECTPKTQTPIYQHELGREWCGLVTQPLSIRSWRTPPPQWTPARRFRVCFAAVQGPFAHFPCVPDANWCASGNLRVQLHFHMLTRGPQVDSTLRRDDDRDNGGSRNPRRCSRDELAIHHLAARRGHPSPLSTILILSSCGGGALLPLNTPSSRDSTRVIVCSALLPPDADHCAKPPITDCECGLDPSCDQAVLGNMPLSNLPPRSYAQHCITTRTVEDALLHQHSRYVHQRCS